MFTIGDKIVYPMHGAGIVESIEKRELSGGIKSYYILKMPIGDLKIMIPTEGKCTEGLRYVISDINVASFTDYFSMLEITDESNWTQRSRDNMERLRSGDIYEVIRVVKSLLVRESIKPLSTGEKKMLTLAKQIMYSELIISLDISQSAIEDIIYNIIQNNRSI